MKRKLFSALISFVLIWVALTAPVLARQVVTEDVKSWAKQAVEQEQALEGISAPPNSVAILYFFNKTDWSNLDLLQKGLTIMLMTDLSRVEEIQLIERVKLQALVDELDLGVSGLVEPDNRSRLGKLLGAEHLIGGDILKSKIEEFQLKANLLKVPTEKVFGQPMVDGKLLAELFRMEKDLLFEIIEELKIELSPELEAELRKPGCSLQALLYFFEGIEKSDVEDYEKAAEFYEKALQKDPDCYLVQEALQELVDLGLIEVEEAYSPPEGMGKPELRVGDRQDIVGEDGTDQRRPTGEEEKKEKEEVEPTPEPTFDFTFYGKTYDLATTVDVSRSTNGILYFSEENFTVSVTMPEGQEPSFQEMEFSYPPFIAPLYVITEYNLSPSDFIVNGVRLSDANGGVDELLNVFEDGGTIEYVPSPLFAAPSVAKSDSFYRYSWDKFHPDVLDPEGGIPLETEAPHFSGTLYKNNWIAFSYGDCEVPGGVEYAAFVGLSPGDGKENHPGPGEDRDFVPLNLSEQTGETIADDEGKYLSIYEAFYSPVDDDVNNEFDLSDSFLIFRPDGSNKYTVTAGTRDMIVDIIGSTEDADMTSLDQAIVDVMDANLLARVDDVFDQEGEVIQHGEFKPGEFGTEGYGAYNEDGWAKWSGYEYGLQTVGQDEYENPVLFTNQESLDRINSNGFLAYAVQVEEDRLNEQIIEMAHHADTIKARVAVHKAHGYADIRARDAALTEMADAQSGRVLKDREGNWVRVQQYVLRPDDRTVQLLNVCLRGADAGDLSGLSTMDFTTTFSGEGYPLEKDLRDLPWNDWLNTQKSVGFNGIISAYYVNTTSDAPELYSMSVKFINPVNESLQESREFKGKISDPTEIGGVIWMQNIGPEKLTINETLNYTYTHRNAPGSNQYTIVSNPVTDGNPDGFKYMINPGPGPQYINVAFYAVGDRGEGIIGGFDGDDDGPGVNFKDIWDALRVNEPGGAPNIGNNNLEIAITDAENNFFSKPIDVVYIPMSRMLWKGINYELY